MKIGYIISCLIVGYLCGCFSSAYFVGKLNHMDIREEGSGNLGSTNALRTLGIQAGILTFSGDILKAAIPILIIRFFIFYSQPQVAIVMALWLGLGVVLGHNFPFWLRFKGGKGIAVTASVTLCIAHWSVIVFGLILFVAIVAVTKYVSVGSLVSAFYLPINTLIFHRDNPYFLHMLMVSFCFTVLAYVRHRENIKRLLNGTERKLGDKAK